MDFPERSNWLLRERNDDFRSLIRSDPREYFAGVRREWTYRRQESERLRNDLIAVGAPIPQRDSLLWYPLATESLGWSRYRRRVIQAVEQIRDENNLMLLRRCRYYMYQLAQDSVRASGRELSENEKQNLLQNPNYLSDGVVSDEGDYSSDD